MSMRRPLRSTLCREKIVIELSGRGDPDNLDTNSIENAINQELSNEASVSTRAGRFDSDYELVASTRSSVILDDDVREVFDTVQQEILSSGITLQMDGWRVEAD